MISLQTKDWQIDNIDTVLFDKDGTFIDLHYFWGKMTEMRADAVIKKFGLSSSIFEQICLFLGYNLNVQKMLSDGITALYSRSRIIEIFRENLKDFGINPTTKEIEDIFDSVSNEFYKNITKYTKPIEEAISFIKELHQKGVKLGIVTSDSIVSTELTLKHFGWENYFEVVIGRESSEFTKESGEPTKIALQALKANPETTLMIGDAPMDYISAKNAGVNKTILVATGQIEKEELRKTNYYVVNNMSEIKITEYLFV